MKRLLNRKKKSIDDMSIFKKIKDFSMSEMRKTMHESVADLNKIEGTQKIVYDKCYKHNYEGTNIRIEIPVLGKFNITEGREGTHLTIISLSTNSHEDWDCVFNEIFRIDSSIVSVEYTTGKRIYKKMLHLELENGYSLKLSVK